MSIFIGGTGSGNELHDYEEGTFSPAIRPGDNSTSASVTVNEANYTKIGRLVHVVAYFSISSNPSGTTGGDTRITGLPFQNINSHGAANIHYFAGLGSSINFLSGTVQGGTTEILLRGNSSEGGSTNNIAYASFFGGGDAIIFSATYQTSA